MGKNFSPKDLERMLEQLIRSNYHYERENSNYYEHHISGRNSFAPYKLNYEEVIEILQREFGVTRGDDSKPVLATYGLGLCVALVGWSPTYKIGFLAHYDANTDLSTSFGHLLYVISKQLEGKESEFYVRIFGGKEHASEQIIDFLKARLNIRKDILMKLIEEETDSYRNNTSIALDTRTGKLFSYNPIFNPYRREITKLDMFGLIAEKTPARLVYAPKKRN